MRYRIRWEKKLDPAFQGAMNWTPGKPEKGAYACVEALNRVHADMKHFVEMEIGETPDHTPSSESL